MSGLWFTFYDCIQLTVYFSFCICISRLLYCCSDEGVLAVCTAILDLCYLKYLLWSDVLDPKESPSVHLFLEERLCITENTELSK